MKKEAIIDIIVNDLKEIELLLENFKDDEKIEGEFIDLLSTKYQNISKEITLLNFWRLDQKIEEQPHNEQPTVEETAPQPTAEPIADLKPEAVVVAKPEPVVEAKPEPVVETKPEPVVETKPIETTKRTAKASDLTNYGTPVNDIKKAIAIADRFLFQKELFGGDANEFNSAIATANGMATYEEAERFLLASYEWDAEDKTTEAFLKAVHRKFI